MTSSRKDNRIEAVPELGREQAIYRLFIFTRTFVPCEPDCRLRQISSTRICRHDQNHITEVHRLAIVVGQLAVIHDLQQDVKDVRMRLFDFIEQQYSVRILIHRVG